jgi:ubiquinone/menaquinone biosynthesis C-methylase UbiE
MGLDVPADVIARANLSNKLRWTWIVSHVEGKILDVGSGSGETWLQTGSLNLDVTLLDLACYKPAPYPFIWADAHHLPFKDKCFDTVVLSEVLEHVVDFEKVLAEAVRVCRKKLVITVPDEHNWEKAVKPFTRRENHLAKGEYERLVLTIPQLKKDVDERHHPHHWHIHWFTWEKLQSSLEKLPLKIAAFEHHVEDLKPFSHWFIIAEVL